MCLGNDLSVTHHIVNTQQHACIASSCSQLIGRAAQSQIFQHEKKGLEVYLKIKTKQWTNKQKKFTFKGLLNFPPWSGSVLVWRLTCQGIRDLWLWVLLCSCIFFETFTETINYGVIHEYVIMIWKQHGKL